MDWFFYNMLQLVIAASIETRRSPIPNSRVRFLIFDEMTSDHTKHGLLTAFLTSPWQASNIRNRTRKLSSTQTAIQEAIRNVALKSVRRVATKNVRDIGCEKACEPPDEHSCLAVSAGQRALQSAHSEPGVRERPCNLLRLPEVGFRNGCRLGRGVAQACRFLQFCSAVVTQPDNCTLVCLLQLIELKSKQGSPCVLAHYSRRTGNI